MSEELLKVQNLKKFFQTPGGSLHAVDDVSFSINEASTLGVVGESGCGKSTLGRILLRLNEPTSGEIWFHGQDVVKASKREMSKIRPKMQMIFQVRAGRSCHGSHENSRIGRTSGFCLST